MRRTELLCGLYRVECRLADVLTTGQRRRPPDEDRALTEALAALTGLIARITWDQDAADRPPAPRQEAM